MDRNSNNDPKINVFGLPNQTTVLAGLIAAVLLGALWIGSIEPAPIPIWPLAIFFTLLPFRIFLARPEKDYRKYEPFCNPKEFLHLTHAIEENARKIGLNRTPYLWVSEKVGDIYARGSYRRWYICVNKELAKELNDQLGGTDTYSIAEVRVLHELFHFKTGDYWQLGLVEDLLGTILWGMSWSYAFLLGWGFLLILATQSFFQTMFELLKGNTDLPSEISDIMVPLLPSVGELEKLQEKVSGINLGSVLMFISSSLFPFIILSFILDVFFKPKLWRMREVYADAGVIQAQKCTRYFRYALVLGGARKASEGRATVTLLNKLWHALCVKFNFGFRHFSPDAIFRLVAIRSPQLIYDDWFKVGVLLGTLILSLDVLLDSTPLTWYYIGALPMHFTTLVILVTVSLSMLPWIVQEKPIDAMIVKITNLIMGLRLIWLLLTISFLLALYILVPTMLSEFLSITVSIIARYAGRQQVRFNDLGGFIIEASIKNLAEVLVVYVILTISLLVVGKAFCRLFTWYSFPNANTQIMRIAYIIVAWIFIIVWWLVLPIVTALLLDSEVIAQPLSWAGMIVAFLVMILGIVIFVKTDRRYGKKCPTCHRKIEGNYTLGKVCSNVTCNQKLNDWLVVDYDSGK